MKTFYLSCFVLCALVAYVGALECYSCTDCLPGVLSVFGGSTTCSDQVLGFDKARCLKQVNSDGSVNRGCSTSAGCLALEVDKCSNPDEKGCYICCDGDRCNSGYAVTSSIVACIASLMFAMVLQ